MGLLAAFLPCLPMELFTSLLLILTLVGIVGITWRLFRQGEKAPGRIFVSATLLTMCLAVPFFWIATGFDETPRDRSMYTPQLYDDCSRLRWLFECGKKPDKVSQFLSAVRCADISMMSVPVRELKPGYLNLSQQCFGG